jgi:uncharacterized protein
MTALLSAPSHRIQANFLPVAAVRLTPSVWHERQEVNRRHLLALDPERLLAPFFARAGLAVAAPPYGGWEGKDIAGHSLGHVLSALAYLGAATGDQQAMLLGDRLIAGLAACQRRWGDGYALPIDRAVFNGLRQGVIEATPFALNGCWVPFYTLHKVLAGLRDAGRLAQREPARTVAAGLCAWLRGLLQDLSDSAIQEILATEHGGMQEVLADLADDLADPGLRGFAFRCFQHAAIVEPLIAGTLALEALHGNTLIPKVIGLAKQYEATGRAELRQAVESFWDEVLHRRSYGIGGHGDSEHFFAPGRFADHLTPYTAETCNATNLLRLAAHLFAWEPRVEIIDDVERILCNHILANIGREPGEFGYFLGLGSVATKVFSQPCAAWWCCVGTGLESPTRYAALAYAQQPGGLWVNLYQAGRLIWAAEGVELVQATAYPRGERIMLHLAAARGSCWCLHLRLPGWCSRPRVAVNGVAIPEPTPRTYLAITRQWLPGDVIQLDLPMALAVEPLPGAPDIWAFRHGPLVLAGIVPPVPGAPDPARERHADHLCARGKTDAQPPVLVWAATAAPEALLLPTGDGPDIYRSQDAVRPVDLVFRPLMDLYEEHYAVYFRRIDPARWPVEAAGLAAAARRAAAVAAARVDLVEPGFQQSEVGHDLVVHASRSGYFRDRPWRDAAVGGHFAYRLACDPEAPCVLDLECWGGEWVACGFTVLVNGREVHVQRLLHDHPGDFFTVSIPLVAPSAALVQVEIRALPGLASGRIFAIAIRRQAGGNARPG